MRSCVHACVYVCTCVYGLFVLNVFLRRLSRTLVYVHVTCLSVNVRLHVRGVGAYVRGRVC